MTHDILLATPSRNISQRITNLAAAQNLRIGTVLSTETIGKFFHTKGESIEIAMIDMTFDEKELDRIIFYMKENQRDIPVILFSHSIEKDREAIKNLWVDSVIKRPTSLHEVKEIVMHLKDMLQKDTEKKFESVEYLKEVDVFACSFKNKEKLFLHRVDVPGKDKSAVKKCSVGDGSFYFTIFLESGNEIVIPWDFVRSVCDRQYKYYKTETKHKITPKEIGRRIINFRTKLNITQDELSEKTGILRNNISRVESGRHYPSIITLEKIAKALNIPVVNLVA